MFFELSSTYIPFLTDENPKGPTLKAIFNVILHYTKRFKDSTRGGINARNV